MADETPKEENKALTATFLQKAEEIAQRNEKAVEAMRLLVERNEELVARNLIGGKSDAGIQTEPVKQETPKEYAERILKTGKL